MSSTSKRLLNPVTLILQDFSNMIFLTVSSKSRFLNLVIILLLIKKTLLTVVEVAGIVKYRLVRTLKYGYLLLLGSQYYKGSD